MDYLQLTGAYKTTQSDRVKRTADQIRERHSSSTPGRIVPETEDIRIGTGRFLNAAVMFLDIVGFSARPNNNQTDQESNLRILALFFSEMFRIVDDYGGTVEKNTGDGLMAYFEDGAGDPPAPGSHRAIACAMTMKRCHRDLINPLIIATGYSPVSFRLSIDYGCITIARVGAPRQFNSIVAIGTTANIASKLQAYADADEVVIGEDVLYSMQPEFSGWVTRIDQNVGFYRILQDGTRRPYQAYKYSGGWVGHAY